MEGIELQNVGVTKFKQFQFLISYLLLFAVLTFIYLKKHLLSLHCISHYKVL